MSIRMPSKSEEYVANLEQFLDGIAVTGTSFCARQYERWRGLAREAFEEAEASTAKEETDEKARPTGKYSA